MTDAADQADRLFAIVSGPDREIENLCPGPTPDGRCPKADAGRVPCAGARVVPLRGTHANGLPFSVPADASAPRCPLDWVAQ